MKFLALPEIDLAYDVAGDAGSPVLLIMGFSMPGRAWMLQVPDLSRHHRVVWFDNRGVGETIAEPGRYSTALFASDVKSLLDHLDWPRAHIVGVSMGGMIAQEFALRNPDRLLSLSLLVTHAGGSHMVLPRPRGLARFLGTTFHSGDDRLRAVARLLFPAEYLATCDQEWLMGVLRSDLGSPVPLRFKLSQMAAVRGHDTGRRLGALAGIPTLIVKAGKDILIPPGESDRLHRLIPGSRLVCFPESGHGVVRQCAAELNLALLDHFRQVDLREVVGSAAGAGAHPAG